jgi:hypothetical protein
MGLQDGYTTYSCLICLCDSRATDQRYIQKLWSEMGQFIAGTQNVIHEALLPRQNTFLPPLRVKLKLLKQFVKALNSNSATLHPIRKTFPHLPTAKVKGGIFTGPQIRVMLASRHHEQTMTVVEKNSS